MKLWSAKVKLIVCLLTPIVFSPLAASSYKESRCAYIILWMSIYWVLEPVHLTVTALLPVPLMPLLGILDATVVCESYMKEVLMMFIGGLAVAVAVEHCKLHERTALKVLMLLGSDTKWLMLGFMMTTMFLSMWISNTATTSMMVPIVNAVIAEIKSCTTQKNPSEQNEQSMTKVNVLQTTLLLSIAYSANCGGTGTLTGTSPNMIFKGYLEDTYPESVEITYASWMAYNVPGMIACVTIGWIVLQLLYVPCWRKDSEETKQRIKHVITTRYKELGAITFHEAAVFSLFVILVFLWMFREPKFMTGWADVIKSETGIGDAVPAIFILVLLFFLPAEPWRLQKSRPLLEWSVVQNKLPWGLVILLGGGYALARGTQESGLSLWLGNQLTLLSVLSPSIVVIIICASTAILTEIISNSTVTIILLPVVNQLALTFKVHPLYFMFPVTIASSYAFMLPVATGPNAIVFDNGPMQTKDMVKPGIIMNIICSCVQVMMINTLGTYLFRLDTFPIWANKSTMLTVNTNIIENKNLTF